MSENGTVLTEALPEAPARMATIDFPQPGELVASRDYTIRIDAPGAVSVEVCIDDGPWLPCREAAGFWWYDWAGYVSGVHLLLARMHGANGHLVGERSRRIRADLR